MTITIHRSDWLSFRFLRYTMREHNTGWLSRVFHLSGLYVSIQVETGEHTATQDVICCWWQVQGK